MIFWLLLACGGKPEDTGWTDCSEAPVVNYDNFGEGFLLHNCQSCHATTTGNRYGAPENVSFDTKESVSQWLGRIYETTIGPQHSMPPAGTIAEDEQVMLYWWLVCEEELLED
jgi:uncharacterized membrane protein